MSRFPERVSRAARQRWVHWENDRAVARMAAEVARNAPHGHDDHPMIFFNASTRLTGMSLNAAFELLTAWALRLQGVPVIQFVCRAGMSRCVLGTNRDDPAAMPPCRECTAQSGRLFTRTDTHGFAFSAEAGLTAAIENLNVDQLCGVTYQGAPLGPLVLPSLRWVLRRHHLSDDEPTRYLFRQYILSAWQVAQEFSALIESSQPRCVVVFNGTFYPEAAARWVARQHGIRVVTHEVGLQPFSAYFTTGEATAYPIDIPDDFELSSEQNERLDHYLEQRFQGNFSMAGIRFWPEMRGLSAEFLERASQFKQIVPVFTNVVFDTSQGHANVVFPHMFAWLDEVLDLMRRHPETLFVLRAHPDEGRQGKESRESVRDWALRNKVTDLPNVVFVDSGEALSSYELIQRSKFVMVYNSTIGLEASLLGAAVLCGGKARFTQLPTVYFPHSVDAYRRQAEEFLAVERIMPEPDHRRNARRFLYYQLFRTSLSFDEYLDEDGVWRGYVRLKSIAWQDLLPERSPSIRAIVTGILEGESFHLEESVPAGQPAGDLSHYEP